MQLQPEFKEIRYLPGHILQVKKLLQTRLPIQDYQPWLQQNPEKMLQDLMDIDFDVSLITWQQIIASQPSIVGMIVADEMVAKQVCRKVLFYLCDVQEIDAPLDNMLIEIFSQDREKLKENRVMPLIDKLDLGYLLSLSSSKRYNFLKLMQTRALTPLAKNGLGMWAHNYKIWYDFTFDQIISLNMPEWTKANIAFSRKGYSQRQVQEINMTLDTGEYLSSDVNNIFRDAIVPSSSVCITIPLSSSLACKLLSACPNLQENDYNSFMITTKKNIKFAVELMQTLVFTQNAFPCIAKDHLIRNIAAKNADDIIKVIPKNIENFNDLDDTNFWQIIRLIVIGLSQKNPELIYDVAKIISVEDFFTMRYVNVLLSVSFNSGYAKAGLQLADHFWRGIGTCPSRNLATTIYKTIATHKPDLLTMEAVDRLSSQCLLSAYTMREECDVLIRQMTTMLYVIPEKKMKPNVMKDIIDAFGNEYYSFFSNNKITPNETLEVLRRNIVSKTKLIIAELNYVVKLNILARPELKNHAGCLTAHVMLLQIINHLTALMPEIKTWTPLRATSLKAIIHFDQSQDIDEEFIKYLRGIKRAPEKDSDGNIEQPSSDAHALLKLFDRPKLDRSTSVPNLPKSEFVLK